MQNLSGIARFLVILSLATSSLTSSSFLSSPAATWQSKVDAALLAASPEGQTEFLIYLAHQADLSGVAAIHSKIEKGRYVYQRLTQAANLSQPALLAALSPLGVEVRSYWIANMIWVRGSTRAMQAAAQRIDVAHIYANPHIKLKEPIRETPAAGSQYFSAAGVEWNIQKVNAPALWAAGVTGQGVVIGGQDTGYDWTHPALKGQYRGWSGASANHNYNWHDAIHSGGGLCGPNSAQPCDDNGHGTHTMGIMVGDDGVGNKIGMAPGAKWIGCRNMNQGVGSPATYAECYQWFLAPTDLNGNNPRPDLAPDVINNSWGCPTYEGCVTPDVLLQSVNNLRAAGILSVHSAGNDGSLCSSVNSPAAIYDSSFTVGATNQDDSIAGFSSRGPVILDGSGRLKPDISAPGTGIRSSRSGGGYVFLSGTSMAGPHVAGLAALLISANPKLAGQVDALEALIEQSAVHLATLESCGNTAGQVPNNVFGWGRIDALAAFSHEHRLTVTKTASASQIEPGGLITYTLQLTHSHPSDPANQVTLYDLLPVGTSFITATLPHTFDGEAIQWAYPSLAPNESRSVELVVQAPLTITQTVQNLFYGATSGEAASPTNVNSVNTRVINPYQVSLSAGQAALALAGQTQVITHILANEGLRTDTYDLALASAQGWSKGSYSTPITLSPGTSTEVSITLTVPFTATVGAIEIAQLSATSKSDPQVTTAVTDTVTVGYPVFYPLVFNR